MSKKNLLICFDAFGTLFTPRKPVAQQYSEVARSFGLGGFTDDDIAKSFKAGEFIDSTQYHCAIQDCPASEVAPASPLPELCLLVNTEGWLYQSQYYKKSGN